MSDESKTQKVFGAASLLSSECDVLYSLIKNSEHLGRITDLVYGRIQSVSPDEYRLRYVFLKLFFNRFTQQKRDQAIPIQVEVGFDSIQVVLGVTAVFEDEPFDFSETEIQELLSCADRVIYKTHAKSKKTELNLVLTTQPEKLDASTRFEKWIIESDEVLKPKRYTEMGDVDLMEILRNLDRTLDDEEQAKETEKRFKDDQPGLAPITRIEGVTQKIEHEKIVIKAGPQPEPKKGFFSKIFGKKQEASPLEVQPAPDAKSAETVAVAEHLPEENESADLEQSAQKIERVRTEIIMIAKESKNDRIQRSMEGLMDEMALEREQMKKHLTHMKAQLRKRELDFQIKEQALSEELQKKEESIRQKNAMIARLKDQASQVQLKSARGGAGGSSDDALFKQKYHNAQKTVNELREEQTKWMKQADQLREKLRRTEEELIERGGGISPKDHQALQSKYDALMQEMNALKTQSTQAQPSASESVVTATPATPAAVDSNSDEFKKKLQAAVKVAAQYRKEAESLRSEVENLKQQLAQGNDSGKKSA